MNVKGSRTMKNKIAGTNFIKRKYDIDRLTTVDLVYLKEQNIKCFWCDMGYVRTYLFTSCKALNKYIKNHYSKQDLLRAVKYDEVKHLQQKLSKKHVTADDLIEFLTRDFDIYRHLLKKRIPADAFMEFLTRDVGKVLKDIAEQNKENNND
jgi:hypothetical protein